MTDWLAKNPTKYVFGTRKDQPEGHYLRILKQFAKMSGQNPERFWLHKFRDTAATRWLDRGVNLRQIQAWLGHTDISVTTRYLAPGNDQKQQDDINKANADLVQYGLSQLQSQSR
jgi:integrase